MRKLLFLLLAINVLYAGWEYYQPTYKNSASRPLPNSLATLELLNEQQRDKEIDESEKIQAIPEDDLESVQLESEGSTDESELACYTLGPFKDVSVMQQMKESMQEEVESITVRELEESEKHRYWVYIPPLPSRKDAKEVAKTLKQANFKDYYVVLGGESRNSISLGHYREPGYANLRVKKVAELGLEASIEVIYKKYNVHWLDYRANKGSQDVESVMNNYGSEGVSRINRACN